MKKYALFLIAIFLYSFVQAQDLDEVIRFIKENPKKASFYLIEDGKIVVDFNSQQQMPLASAVKLLLLLNLLINAVLKRFRR